VETNDGELLAAELDADEALERWLSGKRNALRMVAERGTYFDREDLDEMLDLSLPGADELIGLVEIARAAKKSAAEQIIVDTAPTGHTLRLFAMPDTLERISEVFDGMQAKHRYMKESISGRYRPDGTDEVIESIAAEGRALAELVKDPERCRFTWVLIPETLSVLESLDGIAALEALGVMVDEIIINRLTPPPPEKCALCETRIALEAEALLPLQEKGILFGRTVRRVYAFDPPKVSAEVSPWPHRPLKPSSLLPKKAKLMFVGGKGGVGKTTIAATLALSAAEAKPEQNILLISTDPAHSLADALDMPLSDEPTPVKHGLLARELDAAKAFDRKRVRYRDLVDEMFVALSGGSGFDVAFDRAVLRDLFDLAPPGIDELFAILEVMDLLPKHGLVIVDTAPTGHTLRLLEIPGLAREWVRVFMRIVLKYREVIGLGDLANELLELARQLRELDEVMHDPQKTAFLAVTRAAELPRLETERLLDALYDKKLAVAGVLVNAITPQGCARCARTRIIEAREVRAMSGVDIILTPARAVPPRGVRALEAFGETWRARIS
jgi:arsenite-transporting ATPase